MASLLDKNGNPLRTQRNNVPVTQDTGLTSPVAEENDEGVQENVEHPKGEITESTTVAGSNTNRDVQPRDSAERLQEYDDELSFADLTFPLCDADQDTQDSSDEEEDPPVSEEISEDKHPVDQTEQPSQSLQNSGDTGNNKTANRSRKWLCEHFENHFAVKFPCCEKFYACKKCHNEQSSCSNKNVKSHDVKQIKCIDCGEEQAFAHHCSNSRCNLKFAEHFCDLCKILTGNDRNPYHCKKCGVCRFRDNDEMVHCDVCGVCMDVKFYGTHKCRKGSEHDTCCICLEDTWSGCDILPCSHKMHKECSIKLINSDRTSCPICSESFADKLKEKESKE